MDLVIRDKDAEVVINSRDQLEFYIVSDSHSSTMGEPAVETVAVENVQVEESSTSGKKQIWTNKRPKAQIQIDETANHEFLGKYLK